MQQYLSYFVINYGTISTFIGYAFFCLLATFVLTSIFCPTFDPKENSNHTPPILNNLNFLKILLTYYIILHHEYQVLRWTNDAQYCVEGFFIISGFMIGYTFSPKKDTSSFISNKLIRFIPYIFLGNLLELFTRYEFDGSKFFSGIFMFAYTGIYPKATIYGPSWYLIVLFWVSLLYFILQKICKKEVCHFIIGLITFLTLSATRNVSPLFLDQELPNQYIPLLTNGFVRGLGCMGLGYFLTTTYTPHQPVKNNLSTLFYTFLEVFLCVYLTQAFFVENQVNSRCLILLSFVILIWSFIHQKGYLSTLLEKIKWQTLVKYTLPIYMTHWAICRVQAETNLWSEMQPLARIGLTLTASTILGIIAYYTIKLSYQCSQKLHHHTKQKKRSSQ